MCFAGAVAGVAYAANRKHYDISGMNGTRSLWFANDLSVYIISGVFGVLGYLISFFLQRLKISVDTGALSIVICAILVRKIVSNSQIISCNSTYVCHIRSHLKKNLPNEIIPPFILSLITGIIVKETGNFNICFWISALSLIFIQIDPSFPATHHITLVSGYAVSSSGSILIGIIFGILAQLIFECVNALINYGQFYVDDESNFKSGNRSHFDPPATAIAILSFIIFLF